LRFDLRLLTTVILFGTAHVLSADCAPDRLLKMTVADQSPGIPPGHFAALPKTIYRYKADFARIEEGWDRVNNIHGLIVVNEPDNWIVDLAKKQGRHTVDAKKPFVVNLPIFVAAPDGTALPTELLGLEYGCETEFFDHWKSPETSSIPGHVKRAFGVNEWMVVLLQQKGASVPSMVFLLHGNDIVATIRYLSYERLAPDLTLFANPRV